jgi:hypothetical protein
MKALITLAIIIVVYSIFIHSKSIVGFKEKLKFYWSGIKGAE